jgi:hypothetical protein
MPRDNLGRFKSGNNGGPGRPPGSRNRLGEDVLTAVCADWSKHGPAAIAKVRVENPIAYFRIIASLVPRDQLSPVQSEFDDLSDVELVELLEEEIAKLKSSTRENSSD